MQCWRETRERHIVWMWVREKRQLAREFSNKAQKGCCVLTTTKKGAVSFPFVLKFLNLIHTFYECWQKPNCSHWNLLMDPWQKSVGMFSKFSDGGRICVKVHISHLSTSVTVWITSKITFSNVSLDYFSPSSASVNLCDVTIQLCSIFSYLHTLTHVIISS